MNQIGIIGLGVMGKNICLNMLNHGFKVSGFNRTFTRTKEIMKQNISSFNGFEKLDEFVYSLALPRKILLMVPSGKTVDDIIDLLIPLLQKGDIIMDGGNSFFQDTNRRFIKLATIGINYFGIGISGGEEGALHGPSIMPSGDFTIYKEIQFILETIAAKKDNHPCCSYIGPQGSGHYVKMVHNGIEYADMQLLAEVYLILKYMANYNNQQIADLFDDWDKKDTQSYLLNISATILREKDPRSDNDLIDMILDIAGNKGTGRWTSIESLTQEYNASLLTSAYQARIMSNQTQLRKQYMQTSNTFKDINNDVLYNSYYLAKLLVFIQGFGLYEDASKKYQWHLNYAQIAAIFRSGCIIQSKILRYIMEAYNSGIDNLLLYQKFKAQILNYLPDLRKISSEALKYGLATPIFTNATVFLNQLCALSLGANLIQGQRDFFGAHTYQRIDQKGFEHHNWSHHE